MKLKKYLKDKLYAIILFIISYLIILLIFLAFKIPQEVIIAISLILMLFFFLLLLIDYLRKKRFYTDLLANIESLDKSYLVLETLIKPDFYEGELLYQALYDINKSMNENVNRMETQVKDFKNYIEMWIHEVKIPLATLELISNNHKDKLLKKNKM